MSSTTTKLGVQGWSIEEVFAWANCLIREENARKLEADDVSGIVLLKLNSEIKLWCYGLTRLGPIGLILDAIQQWNNNATSGVGIWTTKTAELSTIYRVLRGRDT